MMATPYRLLLVFFALIFLSLHLSAQPWDLYPHIWKKGDAKTHGIRSLRVLTDDPTGWTNDSIRTFEFDQDGNLTAQSFLAMKNRLILQEKSAYDAVGNQVMFESSYYGGTPTVERRQFDPAGNPIFIEISEDGQSKQKTIQYDASGNELSYQLISEAGDTLERGAWQFEWKGDTFEKQLYVFEGRPVAHTVIIEDTAQRVQRFASYDVDEAGIGKLFIGSWSREDAQGNLVESRTYENTFDCSVGECLSFHSTYAYDDSGRIMVELDELTGLRLAYIYDSQNQVRAIMPQNRRTLFGTVETSVAYNDLGLVERIRYRKAPGGKDILMKVSEFKYEYW